MPSYSIRANVPFSNAVSMFSSPRVLDAVHGRGLWKFSDWEQTNDIGVTTYHRKGVIKGVEVPVFARFLIHGRKYIPCRVKQQYVIEDQVIRVRSTLKPKVAGAEVAKNVTNFIIQPIDEASCTVDVESRNTTNLPDPIKGMALEFMDTMSDETMEFLEDSLR